MVSTAAHLWLNMPKLRSGDRLDSRIYNIAHDWAASVAGSIFHSLTSAVAAKTS